MKLKFFILFLPLFLFILSGPISSYAEEIRPVSVQQPMPDFTLPVLKGGELALSQLKGKNVMIIFPRGLAGKNHWCHICNYQYLDLADLEEKKQIRKEHNLEILFVLPYSREMVAEWVEKFPDQISDIESWKNPEDPDKLNERGKRRMEFARNYFPKSFRVEKGKVPLPFPILIDADRKVSKGLRLFTEEWGGSKVEQNIPTIFIIDSEGVVQFKYMSQSTIDRPSPDYLLKFLEEFLD